jgi:excisionase family DNA binding protein
MEQQAYTTVQVMQIMKWSKPYLYDLIRRKKIKAIQMDKRGHYRIPVKEIDRILKEASR